MEWAFSDTLKREQRTGRPGGVRATLDGIGALFTIQRALGTRNHTLKREQRTRGLGGDRATLDGIGTLFTIQRAHASQ